MENDIARSIVMVAFGLVLIGAGALMLSYGGIPYTSSDVVIDVGPLTATAKSNRTLPVPVFVSGVAIVGGLVLVVVGARKLSTTA